jgi:type II secretory pathway component GspD/PulD (secretin)
MIEENTSNQLILAGNESQLQVIEQILNDLQAAQTARSTRETKLLDGGTPEEMSRLLPLVQQLYRDRMRGRDASDPPDAQIIPDQKNGRFIVTGRTNHIAEIEGILAQLRAGQAGPETRETRVYELTTATASDLSATVRTLYQEQAKTRPGTAATDTLILPDTGANRIIVTGSTNELAIVEDIIKKLDKVGAQSASTRVFKLKSADPEKVAQILATSLVRYDSYGRPQKRVSAVTDVKTRTIIATGDPRELQSAAVIIEQLDASLGEQPARVMRVLAVKGRSVSELSTKVRQIYQDRAREDPELGFSEPLILDDVTSNQIILAGTEKQLAAIDEIAQTLQKSGETSARQELR